LFTYIGELEDLEGDYGALQALLYVFLTLPRRLYDLLPMAALVGCLIGLGTLASNSELTVMRASGVSIGRIMGSVLKPLLALMIAGVLLGEYVVPYTENLADSRRALAVGSGSAVKSKGLWHREGNDFIHINAVHPNGTLHGITRYRFDDERRLIEASFATRASVEEEHWLLQEVAATLPAARGAAGSGRAATARHMALPELSGQSGTEQQPVLAGLLEEAAATGDHGGAGVCRHLFHLRPAALGNARPAGIHRGAGGLQFPHPPGPAGSIESGIRLLPTDRGSGTYPHPGSDGHVADPPGGMS